MADPTEPKSVAMPEQEQIRVLRVALLALAARNAWVAFGECRAFEGLGYAGPMLSALDADMLARRALLSTEDQTVNASPSTDTSSK
jgi:hypothetical protein